MDTLKSMMVFRAVVEQGSFTKAAEHLNMSVAMASKHLHHLEQYIQAKLLNRNNRRQSLTEIGQSYYAECCHALDTLATARTVAQQGTVKPQGKLRIIAPLWFATPYFARLLAEFQAQYPLIQLSLDLENRFTDLIAQGYDLALRVVGTPQENLIVKPLTEIPFYYVASPAYLAQHGTPRSEAELTTHQGVLPNYTQLGVPLIANHDSNNTVMLAEMIKAGMGIGALPKWLVDDAVARGELVQLFPLDKPSPMLYAAYMDRAFLSVKIRCFIDFLSERLNDIRVS